MPTVLDGNVFAATVMHRTYRFFGRLVGNQGARDNMRRRIVTFMLGWPLQSEVFACSFVVRQNMKKFILASCEVVRPAK